MDLAEWVSVQCDFRKSQIDASELSGLAKKSVKWDW